MLAPASGQLVGGADLAGVEAGTVEVPGDHSERVEAHQVVAEPLYQRMVDDQEFGTPSNLDPTTPLSTRSHGMVGYVVDHEGHPRIRADVAELLARCEMRTTDLEGFRAIVQPERHGLRLWLSAGPDGGEATKRMGGEIGPFGVREDHDGAATTGSQLRR
jgi:hypothetical protein